MALDNVLKTIGNIGSAFSPFAGIASAVGSFIGQSKQNAAQLQAQRETNEMNYKIWQEQQQHNVDMFDMQNQANIRNWQMQHNASLQDWQLQNEYNTASAQRQRLEDAGLNPYLMMQGGNAGVAQSQPNMPNMSGAQATPANAPAMQAPHPTAFVDPISTALNQMQQTLVSSSQALKNIVDSGDVGRKNPVVIENIGADTGKKVAETGKAEAEAGKAIADTAKSEAETRESVSRTELNNISKYWQPKLLAQDLISKDRANQASFWSNNILRNQSLISDLTFQDEINLKRATTMNMVLDSQTKEQVLSFMPAQQAAELEVLSMQAYDLYQSGRASAEQAKYFITGQIANRATAFNQSMQGKYYGALTGYYGEMTRGLKADNDFKIKKFDLLGEKMFNAAGLALDLEISTNTNSLNFENMIGDWHKNNQPTNFMKWNYYNYRHLGIKPYIEGKFNFSRELGIPGMDASNGYHLDIMGGYK